MTGSTGTYGAFSIGTTAAPIAGGRTTRKSIVIRNTHASQTLYVGDDSSVTDADGFPVEAGESFEFTDFNGPIYGIGSGAATTGRYFEVA